MSSSPMPISFMEIDVLSHLYAHILEDRYCAALCFYNGVSV